MKYFTLLTVFILASYAVQARSAQGMGTIDFTGYVIALGPKEIRN